MPIETLYNWLYAGIFEPVGKQIYRGREFNTFSRKTIREVLTIKALREFVSFQAMRREFTELTGKYAGQLLLPLWTIKENRRKRK